MYLTRHETKECPGLKKKKEKNVKGHTSNWKKQGTLQESGEDGIILRKKKPFKEDGAKKTRGKQIESKKEE